MITHETIDEKISEYYDKNGKLPKYVLIDKLSRDYMSRAMRPKERIVTGTGSIDNAKISAIGSSVGGTVYILAVESDKELLEAVG